MALRKAERGDIAAMLRLLVQDQISETPDDPSAGLEPYEAAFDAIAANPDDGLWVWEENGEIVGCFQLSFHPGLLMRGGWRAVIEGVRVERGFRSRGIGEQMVREAIAMAKARDCRVLQLSTNKNRRDAQRFYRRLGFTASHEGMKLGL